MASTTTNIGRGLKVARAMSGLKQGKAAKALCITHTYLSLLEHGRRDPSLKLLRRISVLYDVPISSLLCEE